ncbi:chemotaxis protein CheC [Desulfobacula toluolica]|uniref:CheC domain protein n=1 Tax=Desulfobacula toluolica (strain DSM 7467 / Tol2) TaxID=651182 RepID=K0NAZ1_DESTT|nr:chemotaxis protein CheC [Desulfobacula toluolica]CCK81399.1 CheC domain protein [Desulfobacula toluolica Tol2]
MKTTEKQIEALRELINIGVGKSASILNTMLNSHIILQVPLLKILNISELNNEVKAFSKGKLSTVILKFDGPFSGSAELIFPSETAMILVNSLVGENPIGMDFDSIRSGTLCEIGNVVLNGVMGSISNIFSSYFKYSVPEYIEDFAENIFSEKAVDFDMKVLLAKTKFIIKELNIDGDIMLFFEVSALDRLIEMIEEL